MIEVHATSWKALLAVHTRRRLEPLDEHVCPRSSISDCSSRRLRRIFRVGAPLLVRLPLPIWAQFQLRQTCYLGARLTDWLKSVGATFVFAESSHRLCGAALPAQFCCRA